MGNSQGFEGIILKGVGGLYTIQLGDEQMVLAKPRGIFRKQEISPLPGDKVILVLSEDPDIPYSIDKILPRKNLSTRPAVANIDSMLIFSSASNPEPDFQFIDKMIILSKKFGIDVELCVTKSDLDSELAEEIVKIYRAAGFRALTTGFDKDLSQKKLVEIFKGKTVAFAGLSGTGKSTLFNRILGTNHMEVGELTAGGRRGKHTTRHAELVEYLGGYIIDTPGFSSIELTDLGVNGDEVEDAYPELLEIRDMCRFTGCRHLGDLGCAVEEADIDTGRLERYREFRELVDSIPDYLKK